MITTTIDNLLRAGIPILPTKSTSSSSHIILDVDESRDHIGAWRECSRDSVEAVVHGSGVSGWVPIRSDTGRRLVRLMEESGGLERENPQQMSVLPRVLVTERNNLGRLWTDQERHNRFPICA